MSCVKDSTPECSHFQDVGVSCRETCTNGDVRLVQGPNNSSGRVEVCTGGQWGTVCDDEWETVDARVVCKQLGLPYDGAEARVGSFFGPGDDAIHLSNVYCTDDNTRLIECNYITGTSINCAHNEDAGVICQSACSNGDVRLAGGTGPYEGRVEVCFNKEWGTVCDNNWNTIDGRVVCQQLGFSTDGTLKMSSGVNYYIFIFFF